MDAAIKGCPHVCMLLKATGVVYIMTADAASLCAGRNNDLLDGRVINC